MFKVNSNRKSKRAQPSRDTILRNRFFKHQEAKEEEVYVPPADDGRKHIKWADELEEVKTFKKFPSTKRIEILQENFRNTSKVCGKSILRKCVKDIPHCNSDTEASSNCSEAEIIHQSRRSAVKKGVPRKSASLSRPMTEKPKPVSRYPNSHYLEELLMARIKRKYNIPTDVSFY